MAGNVQILVLGATGYIGGSALSEILKADQAYAISALVRKSEQVEKLKEVGVTGILFQSLDDLNVIRDAASKADVVIAAASARHGDCAKACIEGLAQRGAATRRDMHYIHTSGASMLGDWPETGGRIDTTTHSDVDEDIFTLERDFPENFSPVREVNQLVVKTGELNKVKTYIVPPPLIFGRGTGLFTEGEGQVHMMTQLALKKKQAVMIGSGSGIWSRVHILDLSNLYLLLLQSVLQKETPSGRQGYYFAEDGIQSWKYIAEGIAKEGKDLGILENGEVGPIELQEVADVFYKGSLRDAEGVLASNARIKADRARQVLGWRPKFGDYAFEQEIKDVVTTTSKQ